MFFWESFPKCVHPPPTPGFLWDLRKRKVNFGSKKTIFGVIWFFVVVGFGPCLGNSHPTHPHLGKISPKKNVFFWQLPLAWHKPVVVWCCFNCVDVDLESFHSAWMNPYLVCIQIIWECNKIVLYELYQILYVTAWWQKQTLFIYVHWNWIVLYSVDTLNLVSDVWMEIQW